MADPQAAVRWTTTDLELLPDDNQRYEIIDGELFVSRAPRDEHQAVTALAIGVLHQWNQVHRLGIVLNGPGMIFDQYDSVIPDLVWISRERYRTAHRDEDGHLHFAPELVVEVLSPGAENERRDREAKLKLYSVQGVDEYWILDWRAKAVSIYRRQDAVLTLVATLRQQDTLMSPLLPGLSVPVATLFDWEETAV
jgi:Uma2 family endonuclease